MKHADYRKDPRVFFSIYISGRGYTARHLPLEQALDGFLLWSKSGHKPVLFVDSVPSYVQTHLKSSQGVAK